jgi:hypothetical protein
MKALGPIYEQALQDMHWANAYRGRLGYQHVESAACASLNRFFDELETQIIEGARMWPPLTSAS